MQFNKQFFKDAFGWGAVLWLFGYILGIIFFMAMPPSMIGWVITPIATAVTIWVLWKKIHGTTLQYYFFIAIVWTLLAVVLDYFMIVKAFHPDDGYYKFDVYLYYSLTFILPVVTGFLKKNKQQ